MVHHHHHHSSGCASAILAFTVAGVIVWTVENAWPYLLGAFVLCALLSAVVRARKGPAPVATPGPAPRIGEHKPQLRMTDSDRERVAEALRTAGGDGRLDASELEERTAAAYAAKRWADAAPLIEDLG